MHGEHTIELDIILYMNKVKNPMCTVGEITKHLTGRWVDSRDKDYAKTYRTLERMTQEKLLFGIGTTNGGNVYISRQRVVSPIGVGLEWQGENDDLPY